MLCIVWVTVHGHCTQTLFMDTIQKKKEKKKNDPRDLRRHILVSEIR